MFSHVTIGSNDVGRAKAFYDALLQPLGLVRHMDYPNAVGYGPAGGRPQLWVLNPLDKNAASVGNGITIGLEAPDRGAVDAAHKAAWRLVARTKVLRASARTITPTTTVRICATSTATRSVWSAIASPSRSEVHPPA